MNVANYICKYLLAYHVRSIFGYPGAAILPMMEALRSHKDLHWILMRHEGSAALAASAHGKITGKLSVCMTSSGPAATNTLTGLLDAQLDRSPVLLITGLLSTEKHGLSFFQEIEQVDILAPGCGFNGRAIEPMQAIELLQNAVGYAIKNQSVAHLAIPHNIQTMEFTQLQLNGILHYLENLHYSLELFPPPQKAYDLIFKTLAQYSNVVFAVGHRARPAGQLIEKLSEKWNTVIISTFSGKGVINENHPNYFGVLGMFGAPANDLALKAIKKADLVISFGVDDILPFLTTEEISQQRDLIQCDTSVSSLFYQFVQVRILLGRMEDILQELLNNKQIAFPDDYLKSLKKEKSLLEMARQTTNYSTASGLIHPKLFFETLNPYIDRNNLTLCLDIGDNSVWAVHILSLTQYQNTIVSNRLGTMGFCLPAMIAAKLAHPERLVVGICGDGGLQMCLGEIMTTVQENLNIYLFIINNGKLQRVAERQRGISYGIELYNPHFAALAQSCGATGFSIEKNDDINKQLTAIFSVKNGPVFIDVKSDPDIYAPMTMW